MKTALKITLAAIILSLASNLYAGDENLNSKERADPNFRIKPNQNAAERAKLNASDLKVKPADKLNSKESAEAAKLKAEDLKQKSPEKIMVKEKIKRKGLNEN